MTAVSPVVGHTVHTFESLDSTQSCLARLAADGAAEGTVVVARHQTAGRGRRGHRWWDAPGESLLVSTLLRPPILTTQAPQLSLVAGVAVADVLDAVCEMPVGIRWPNDVMIGRRKIAGVLPEAVSQADGRVGHIILGIGINVSQRDFPPDLQDQATSLWLETGMAHDQARLLSSLLDALDRRYGEWLRAGFAALRDDWRRHASTLGERVRVPGGVEGVAVDVDETGALLVDTGCGALTRVVSGTVQADPAERSA